MGEWVNRGRFIKVKFKVLSCCYQLQNLLFRQSENCRVDLVMTCAFFLLKFLFVDFLLCNHFYL